MYKSPSIRHKTAIRQELLEKNIEEGQEFKELDAKGRGQNVWLGKQIGRSDAGVWRITSTQSCSSCDPDANPSVSLSDSVRSLCSPGSRLSVWALTSVRQTSQGLMNIDPSPLTHVQPHHRGGPRGQPHHYFEVSTRNVHWFVSLIWITQKRGFPRW